MPPGCNIGFIFLSQDGVGIEILTFTTKDFYVTFKFKFGVNVENSIL